MNPSQKIFIPPLRFFVFSGELVRVSGACSPSFPLKPYNGLKRLFYKSFILFYTLARVLSIAFSEKRVFSVCFRPFFIFFNRTKPNFAGFFASYAFFSFSPANFSTSKFFHGSSSGGSATNFNRSFVTGCVNESEYANSASFPFFAVAPP